MARGWSEVGERLRNEEDGRHGLRGCSEVGELVRMRRTADGSEVRKRGGWPRAQMKRTAAMVSEAVRR